MTKKILECNKGEAMIRYNGSSVRLRDDFPSEAGAKRQRVDIFKTVWRNKALQ